MPANLTPQYFEAEEKFKKAATTAEKVEALQEMLRVIPKHKGTEKMQADLKRRLARLRRQPASKATASHRPFHCVEREGAGQVVVCGPPNSGKSTLLDRLTHAEVQVAEYPFTTRGPQAGMMTFEDIQIQLVDTPPLAPEVLEPWQLAMIGQADIALVVFDVNDPDLLDQTEFVLSKLAEREIRPGPNQVRPKLVFLGNKTDQPQGRDNWAAWQELYQDRFEVIPFSARSPEHLEHLKGLLFELLEIVRVYTKRPGHGAEEDPTPFVLRKGSTVLDAARSVHKDLADQFKFARIWGKTKFDGQMVERTHVIEDGDLLEIHV